MQPQTRLEDPEISGSEWAFDLPVEVHPHPRFSRPLEVTIRQGALLSTAPWVRSLGKLKMEVSVQGWKFPLPPDLLTSPIASQKVTAPPPPLTEPSPLLALVSKSVAYDDPRPDGKPNSWRRAANHERVRSQELKLP